MVAESAGLAAARRGPAGAGRCAPLALPSGDPGPVRPRLAAVLQRAAEAPAGRPDLAAERAAGECGTRWRKRPASHGIANSWRPRCGSGGRCGADSGRTLRYPPEIRSVVHRFRDAAIGSAGKPATPIRERCCDASVRHSRLRPTTRWMLARRDGSDTDTAAFAEHRWTFCHALAGMGVAHVGG